MRPRPLRLVVVLAIALTVVLTGCASDPAAQDDPPGSSSPSPTTAPPSSTTPPPTPAPAPSRASQPAAVDPDDVRATTAMAAVRHLANEVGPRHATSPAYRRAAAWVERRLERLGWEVRRQAVPTPAGVSWGVPVPSGRSVNLIATRPDDAPTGGWLVAGAHLDTVPQAPGAEDNASGVGALLAVAEALGERRTRLPVTLVAFGSEEPRGPSDDDHHYGSQRYVASLSAAERRSLRGMVSLDRVGVGAVMPVASAGAPDRMRAQLLTAARRADVAVDPQTESRSSDHWSFVRDGLPAARLGSTPYAGYHSPGDVPSAIDPAQLERAARIAVAWLAPR